MAVRSTCASVGIVVSTFQDRSLFCGVVNSKYAIWFCDMRQVTLTF